MPPAQLTSTPFVTSIASIESISFRRSNQCPVGGTLFSSQPQHSSPLSLPFPASRRRVEQPRRTFHECPMANRTLQGCGSRSDRHIGIFVITARNLVHFSSSAPLGLCRPDKELLKV